MKNIFLLLCMIVSLGLYSQNRPKYILVPVNFSFSKMDNPYNLSALTKSYFQKEGFEAYLENDVLPAELAANRCLAWKADLKESNAFLVTKLVVEVKDCFGNSIAVSQEGKSREKERRIGYSEAFREAVKTLEIPKEAMMTTYMMIPSGENKTSNVQGGMNPNSSIVKSQSDFPALQNNLNSQTQEKKELVSSSLNASGISETFYAQPNERGFQLVDATPKIVLLLQKTSRDDVFIGVRNQISGVVYTRNNQWYFEYYHDHKLVSEKLNIKF